MTDGVAGWRGADGPAREISGMNINSNSKTQTDDNWPIRVILADDRRLCRECVKLLIETIDPRLDVVEANDVGQIVPLLAEAPGRGVVLYNLVLADREGIDFVGTLGKSLGNIPLIVMCDANDSEIMRGVLERGAKAFLPSTTRGPLLVAILHMVIEGGVYAPASMVLDYPSNPGESEGRTRTNVKREQVIAEKFPALTPRQRHVLALLSQGLTNRDIAGSLDMCENTVKAHVKQVMRKLSAENRTQAALMADRLIA